MNIIEPPIDRGFIFDSFACRQGKGVHSAVNRYQQWGKRYPCVLKMDIEQYFPSIDLLGYQVCPPTRKLRNDNGHTFHRRLRKLRGFVPG